MAIRLNPNPQPRWVELGNEVALFCLPPTSYLVSAARAQAQALLVDLIEAPEVVTKFGGRIVGVPDISTPERTKGVLDSLVTVCLAEIAATDWRNVNGADGEPLAFNSALIVELLSQADFASAFAEGYMRPIHEVDLEGK
jgi:hypothetical protein